MRFAFYTKFSCINGGETRSPGLVKGIVFKEKTREIKIKKFPTCFKTFLVCKKVFFKTLLYNQFMTTNDTAPTTIKQWCLYLRLMHNIGCRHALFHASATTRLIEHFLHNPLQAQSHFPMCNYRQLHRGLCMHVCVWFQRSHWRSIVNQQSTRSLWDQPIDSLTGQSIWSKVLLKLNSDQKMDDKQHRRGQTQECNTGCWNKSRFMIY